MEVRLIDNTKLSTCVIAGRTAWQSFHKGGNYDIPTDNITETDKEFLDRILNKHKHSSVAEHLVYSFSIEGISRACLIELSRHRMSSFTVESTRYTLTKELKSEEPFTEYTDFNEQEYLQDGYERACKYLVMTENEHVNRYSILALDNLRDLLVSGISNDLAKYALPEAYKVRLQWTVNARSLQNFLALRTSKDALWEIRLLAATIYQSIPHDHKFLFTDYMKDTTCV
ncbi:MAG: FAD-dependent thymidylate synthase [Bacteroidia bacterium]|nr:FAD-dependent thymidylate synthase [Bacteroidia bacterium]